MDVSPTIDPKLQKRIDEWYKNKSYEEDDNETIILQSRADFDVILHQHKLIEFTPGGKVGDSEWQLQFMHNMSVILERKKRTNPPIIAPLTYIILDENDQKIVSSLQIIINDLLLDNTYIEWSTIFQASIDIFPNIPIYLNRKNIYFLNTYGQETVFGKLKSPDKVEMKHYKVHTAEW